MGTNRSRLCPPRADPLQNRLLRRSIPDCRKDEEGGAAVEVCGGAGYGIVRGRYTAEGRIRDWQRHWGRLSLGVRQAFHSEGMTVRVDAGTMISPRVSRTSCFIGPSVLIIVEGGTPKWRCQMPDANPSGNVHGVSGLGYVERARPGKTIVQRWSIWGFCCFLGKVELPEL